MASVALVAVVLQLLFLWHSCCREKTPAHPQLSVSPKQAVYRTGESINLTCRSPTKRPLSMVGFTNGKWVLYIRSPLASSDSFTHSLRLSSQDSGEYTCSYSLKESPEQVKSQNRIHIVVIDPPPPPRLEVRPPSPAVNEGDHLLVVCSANGEGTEKRFHFYRDGVEMTTNTQGASEVSGNVSRDAFLRIMKATLNHTGEFACRYEERRSNVWVTSPWSRKVYLTAWAPKTHDPWVIFTFSALPFSILMIPLAFYCGRKKHALHCQNPRKSEDDTDCEYVQMSAVGPQSNSRDQPALQTFLPPALVLPTPQQAMEYGCQPPMEGEEELYTNIECRKGSQK